MSSKLGFELQGLERELYFGRYRPDKIGEIASQMTFIDWTESFKLEAYGWKCRLRDNVFDDRSPDWMLRSMKQNQISLVVMMNLVSGHLDEYHPEDCKVYYLEILRVLEELMLFFREECIYFNPDLRMPDLLRKRETEILLQRRNLLHARMKSRGIDERVLQAVLWRLDGFMAREHCSFAELDHMKQIALQMLALLDRKVPDGEAWNSRDFIRYYREVFKDGAEMLTDPAAKQLPEVSTDEQFRTSATALNVDKVSLNLNNEELAMLAQLNIDEKVADLESGRYLAFCRRLVAGVHTIGRKDLSAENLNKLRTKYAADTCISVLRLLERMVSRVREDYMLRGPSK